MATHRIYNPWNIQKLRRLFSYNGQPFNKNTFALLTLILVASATLAIFVINTIKLVNINTPVKTTMITESREAVPIEKTGIDDWAEVPISKTGAGPLHAASYAAPVEVSLIQTAPPIPVKTTTSPTPKVKNLDRFAIDKHLYRAREYEMKGEYSEALASYQKAINIEKDNFIVLNNISYIYLQLGLLKESIEYSLMAINVNRDYVPALTNVGIAYAKTGDLRTAEYHLASALKLAPSNQDLILNLGFLHERQDRFTEASEHYLKLIKFDNISGALGLARVYEKEGRTAEAVKFYRNIYNRGSIDSKTKAFVRQRVFILQNNQMKTGK